MKIADIQAHKKDRIEQVRATARAQEQEIRDQADRLILTVIEATAQHYPTRNRIAQALGIPISNLTHYANRLGARLPKPLIKHRTH